MKLIKLTISAFGPFAKTESIDFDALGDNPLFLIDGPTGAGKSSILHAVCFALYGETTDKERKDMGLRSDHAPSDLMTSVELTFSVRDKTYRITREPTQQRPAKRGEGFTTHQATAQLTDILPDGSEHTLVAKKKKDADEAILTIVGLSADQFRQVMVLPQGKFRELLLAKSDDRQQILSTLFQTQIYRLIEDELKSRAGEIETQHKKFETQIFETLTDVSVKTEDELALAINTANEQFTTADTFFNAQTAQSVKAQKALDDANALLDQFSLLTRLQEDIAKHELGKPEHIANQAKLKEASTANTLVPKYHDLKREKGAVEKASTALKTATLQKTEKQNVFDSAKSEFDHFAPEYAKRDGLLNDKVELDAVKKRINEIEQQQSQLNREKELAQGLKTSLTQKQAAIGKLQQKREELEKQERQLGQQVNKLPEALEVERLSAERLTFAEQRDNVLKSINKLETVIQTEAVETTNADEAYRKAKSDAQQKEHHWYQNIATELSAQLVSGEPCAVCGSKDHPAPATTEHGDEPTSKDDVDNARAQEHAKRDELERAKNTLNVKKLELKTAKESRDKILLSLGTYAEHSTDDIRTISAEATKAHQTLKNQQEELNKVMMALPKTRDEIEQARKEEEQFTTQFATKDGEIQAKQKAIDAAKSTLSSDLNSSEKVDNRIQTLTAQVANLDNKHKQLSTAQSKAEKDHIAANQTAVECQTRLQETTDNHKAAEAAWATELKNSPFDTAEIFQLALLEDSAYQTLEKEIRDYDDLTLTYKTQKQALTKFLKDKQKPDTASLQRSVNEWAEKVTEAQVKRDNVKKRKDELDKATAKLSDIRKQQDTIRTQYEVIGKLNKAASGKGNVRVTLERFVLGVLLDQVLEVATQRLKIMSKGQYYLERMDEELQKKNTTAGLDLAVFDTHSGKSRPVQTLSGGESFMASLSLALALSEVVQQRSGGIQLDTLFVDEGFGSLDQESLQQAINTLVDLQSTGRTIGIISHVSELKQQMQLRIDVSSNGAGSNIAIAS